MSASLSEQWVARERSAPVHRCAEVRGTTATGHVSWFNSERRFGFGKLANRLGDAFLHFDVLKEGGYYIVPRGTTVEVSFAPQHGKLRVLNVLDVDTSTAQHGEPPALTRKHA